MSTYIDILKNFKDKKRVVLGLIGTSVGCGYYANNWNLLVGTPNTIGLPAGYDQLSPASRVDTRIQSAAIQLRAYLKAQNSASDLYNHSGNGWKTDNHIANNTVGKLALENPKPDAVLLALQINDRNQTDSTFINNTNALIQSIRDNSMVPILVKESDIDDSNGKMAHILTLVDQIANNQNLSIIDLNTAFDTAFTESEGASQSGLLYDTIHPNQTGHNLMFQQYKAWLEQEIVETPITKPIKSAFNFGTYLNELKNKYILTANIYSNLLCTEKAGFDFLTPGQTSIYDRWLKNESEIPISVTLSTSDNSITLSPDGNAYSNSVAFLLQPNEVKNFKARIVAGTANKTFTITKTIRG